VDAGDQRTHTWELPGRVLVNGIPADTLPMAVAAGDWLVDWRRRGAPEFELRVLPSGDRDVGSDIEVNLPHMPTALAARYPVSDRGGQITARVLRRTPVVAGADLACILAPPADQAIIAAPSGSAPAAPSYVVPEFTLAKAVTDPTRVATVTITNAADLAGIAADTQWQYKVSATEPAGTGIAFGPIDPDVEPVFDLPPVTAGSVLWVRGMATTGGGWTAWQSINLSTTTGIVYSDFGAGPVPVQSNFGSGAVLVTGSFT
jgi:hypothetical protein